MLNIPFGVYYKQMSIVQAFRTTDKIVNIVTKVRWTREFPFAFCYKNAIRCVMF